MAVTLDRQLDYGEKDARAYAARNYGIRYLIYDRSASCFNQTGCFRHGGSCHRIVFDEAGCDSESSDSQVYLYQNFWQRKVKFMGNEVDFMVHGYVL